MSPCPRDHITVTRQKPCRLERRHALDERSHLPSDPVRRGDPPARFDALAACLTADSTRAVPQYTCDRTQEARTRYSPRGDYSPADIRLFPAKEMIRKIESSRFIGRSSL